MSDHVQMEGERQKKKKKNESKDEKEDDRLCEEAWMEQSKYGYRVQISGWMRNLFVDLISKHPINSVCVWEWKLAKRQISVFVAGSKNIPKQKQLFNSMLGSI